jgi:arabinofuranan 3-O-arabinosyltransferase
VAISENLPRRTSAVAHDLARRARDSERGLLWPCVLFLATAAAVAVFTNSPGAYVNDVLVGDNFYSFFAEPWKLLARNAWLWDSVHGLGRTRSNFVPVPLAALGGLRALGASTFVTERLWHVALLTSAGAGMLAVVRLFRPRVGLAHVVAALVYMFGPYSALYLIPSAYFLGYALAPWFLVVFVRAVTGRHPWRWAAVFALLVFIPGNLNYAVLVYSLLPIVPAACYLVYVDRSVRARTVFSWLARALLLVIVVSLPAIVTTVLDSDVVAANLSGTELPRQIAGNSSWSESWRGLGWWLAYLFSSSRTLDLRQFAGYYDSVPGMAASFAVPLFALGTVWLSRDRLRLFFGGILVLGVAIMAGAYPIANSSPYGRVFLDAVEDFVFLRGFRGTFKAVPICALGLAGLVALGTAGLQARWRGRRVPLITAAVVGTALLVVASFPFWTGSLYRPSDDMRAVPQYWHAATSWLNDQHGEGRVLVIPSTVNAVYTWGVAADDFFDSQLTRNHIVRPQIGEVLGTPESANVLQALYDYLESGDYAPGVLAPIAKRLGIKYLVIRNDLDWATTRRPAPSSFAGIRTDPDLALARTFGARGENVLSRGDPSARGLRPVEIFEVRGTTSSVRTTSRPALLVSGDGAAWPGLSEVGLLDQSGPIRYTGDTANRDIADALADGSLAVITDTNRRRDLQIPTEGALGGYSYTLTPEERRVRATAKLFERRGVSSVAYFRDAAAIRASSYGSPLVRSEPWFRPSNAFDGVDTSAWTFGALEQNPTGAWIEVRLRRATRIGSLDLQQVPLSLRGRRIARVTVFLSGGHRVPVTLARNTTHVSFTPRSTRVVRVRIDKIAGKGSGALGFAEIRIPGLDLREYIQVPDELARRARHDGVLAAALTSGPVRYQFTRVTSTQPGAPDLEMDLRRRFRTSGARSYVLQGTMRFGAYTPERLKDALRTRASDGNAADCLGDVVVLDGHEVRVRIDADAAALASSDPVHFEACAPVEVAGGWHTIENTPGTQIDEVHLSAGQQAGSGAEPTPPRHSSSAHGSVSAALDAPAGSAVIIGQSFDSGWHADSNGRELAAPISLDTQTAFQVGRHGAREIAARFEPERLYRISLVIAGIGLVLCVALVVSPAFARRSRDRLT